MTKSPTSVEEGRGGIRSLNACRYFRSTKVRAYIGTSSICECKERQKGGGGFISPPPLFGRRSKETSYVGGESKGGRPSSLLPLLPSLRLSLRNSIWQLRADGATAEFGGRSGGRWTWKREGESNHVPPEREYSVFKGLRLGIRRKKKRMIESR